MEVIEIVYKNFVVIQNKIKINYFKILIILIKYIKDLQKNKKTKNINFMKSIWALY